MLSLFQGLLQDTIFEKSMFWRSFDEQKYRVKLYGSKKDFKQGIAVYVTQNEAMVVVLQLFKRGKFFGVPGMCHQKSDRSILSCSAW